AAGVAHEHVEARTTVDAVLVGRVRVGRVVEPGVRAENVVGVRQVIAPTGPDRVVAGAADHPVVPEVAEDRVATVRDHGSGSGAAIARRLDAAGSGDAAVVRVEVQEVLVG